MAEQIVPEVSAYAADSNKPDPTAQSISQSIVQSPADPLANISNQIRISRRLPMMNNDEVVELHPNDLIIGRTSMDILDALPHFNGIYLRIPRYYVINSVTKAPSLITPHVRAIATMISSILARRMLSSNIVLQVSTVLLSVSYA